MKTKYLILILAMALVSTFGVIAIAQKSKSTTPQFMETRWKKVEELAEKQMPESALKEVEAILAQAKKDKNSGQILKAMMYRMRFMTDKNPDEIIPLMQEFEAETAKTTDPADKAVMYAMTAELYNNYYQSNQYNINRRTDLEGATPEDVKEWTRSHFVNKIVELSNLSLVNPDVLKKNDALKYSDILELGKDSRVIKPTLFDFLSYKKIDLLKNFANSDGNLYPNRPLQINILRTSSAGTEGSTSDASIQQQITETYNQLIDFNRQKSNKPALVYTELQKLLFENPNRDDEFLAKINELEKKYNDNEAVVEILAEKANLYIQKHEELPEAEKDTEKFRKTAYEITQDGIKKFPNYKRIGLLKNIQNGILTKVLYSQNDKIAKPNASLKIDVKSQNISQVKLTVYKVNATVIEYQKYMMNDNRRYQKSLYPKRTQVFTQTLATKKTDNFDQIDTIFTIKTGDYGIYEYTIEEPDNQKAEAKALGGFTVTDLAFIQRQSENQPSKNTKNGQNAESESYVVNRVSGKPLKDVAVSIYNQKWNGNKYELNFVKKVTSSTDGKYLIPSDRNQGSDIAVFERGNDKYFTSNTHSYWYGSTQETKADVVVSLFTDRSIYRPGQTVYYKGIAYFSDKTRQEVAKSQSFDVELFNVNGEKVGSQKVTSNDFGSFAGSFILPETGLNGAYRMSVKGMSISFWVEEYKRPTFEVTIERPKDEVRFGEQVTVKGNVKAYAGYNISAADVKYRVVRRPHRFWWWHSEPDKIITTGTAKSDNEGNFEVKFTPEKDKTKNTFNPWRDISNDTYYTYFVYANVTDPKGETQQGEQSLSVGDKSLFILADMPEKVDRNEKISLDVITQTLNGETVQSTVNYKIVRLENSDVYYEKADDKTVWKEGASILSGSLETNEKLELDLKKIPSGMYKIIFTTKDNRGNEVKTEDRFILYDKKDKQLPIKAYKWMTTSNTELKPGEKATINFGTSTKNSWVLYELMQGKKTLESRWVEFNDEIKTFEIPFKESYGAGVTALFTFVKDEQFFTERVVISRKVEEKKLTPSVSVFRDKLKPGENAEWTIHIPETAKDQKTAELLIGMYDASLDALRPHAWSFNPTYREQVPFAPVWNGKGFGETDGDWANISERKYSEVEDFEFDDFNWFGLDGMFFNQVAVTAFGGRVSGLKVRGMDSMKKEMPVAMDESLQLNEAVVMSAAAETADAVGGDVKEKSKPQIRTNFNETAFFYPQLRTDDKGNVKVSFTAPESLTRWNVKMLAHTQDLYFGQNEMQAITQKELMVQMNLPRFVRKSDKLVLMANVTNLSDEPLTPNVTLTIEDAPHSPKGGVVIAPKQTVSYEWSLDNFQDKDLAIVKIVAETEKFSDGEQRYLPILPDKVLVTESQTMTLRAGQTRTFTFDNFIKNLKNVDTENFTVEYAGNPTWYAVQALPSVAKTDGENAIDYLTGYYANTLGSYIANANPKLASTFERWKKAGGTRDALLSNLEKNQELKNMLLEETPWVMAAKDETEQKKQIALLFDLNQTRNQAQTYMEKLLKLQAPSGGFAWFEKMPESRYITQEILLNLARLNKMVKSKNDSPQIKKALEYLDLQIAKDFFELRKWNKDYHKQQTINNLQLFYLHTRSEYPNVPIHKSAEEAVKYYTAQSEKYWTSWTLYGKAMMATVAHRNGKTQLANEILTSIRENAMKTDELGMYWNANKAGWWWHERPIATQTAIIEAFGEIRDARSDMDEMKIWLLKQKQTQRWDTPISTLDAIYALLNYGTDWISNEGDVVIKLGNTTLKPNEIEAGTAYIKETIPTETLKPEMGNITVESKSTSGISWGSAYWQYYQDVNKVQSQGKEMKISKQLFVEKMTNQGKSMTPIAQTKLKKGDKVITRLVVTTDRDLEFVLLKDLRASCFEPVVQTSGTKWKEGTVYYQTTKDASTQFFFNYLAKGTYVFEYELWANNSGTFSSGMASIQCHYAPEFVSHTGGEKIVVK